MSIQPSDILYKLSTLSGSAGNTESGTPAGSLGRWISTTEITSASLHNLFDAVTGDENAASEAEYRCLFVENSHATLPLQNPVAFLSSEIAGGASAAIGVDPTAASAIGSSSAQAVEIADENTAPEGVTFSSPTTKGTGISLGTIGPGECRAVWVRRTAANTAAKSGDGATLRVDGDTAE